MHERAGDEAVYQAAFNSLVHFNEPWCGFRLPVSAFAIPLASVDHQTWQLADRYLESQQAPNAATVYEDVIGLIRTLLPTGSSSSEAIASHLAMHKRTLQRHLNREGTSYEQLLKTNGATSPTSTCWNPNSNSARSPDCWAIPNSPRSTERADTGLV